jgi:exosome complex component RRP41
MKGMVTAVAAGRIDGVVCLDLSREEDNFGKTDFPVAIVPKTGEIVLLQQDGNFKPEEVERALDLATGAAMEIYEIQKDALLRRYQSMAQGDDEDKPAEEPAMPDAMGEAPPMHDHEAEHPEVG